MLDPLRSDRGRDLFGRLPRIGRSASTWLPPVLIGLGVLFRLRSHLAVRSLWLDEATLALCIIQRPFPVFLDASDACPAAPPAFSIIEKLAVLAFGVREPSFRLFPLISGLVSLFAFFWLARRLLSPRALCIGLGLFAISGPLISYSSEAKQYSTDVAVASVLWLLAVRGFDRRERALGTGLLFALAGAAALWFSHPAVFVLAGSGLALAAPSVLDRNWARMRPLALAALAWVASFACLYFFFVRSSTHRASLLAYWQSGFVPRPFLSMASMRWVVDALSRVFEATLGLSAPGLGAFAFLVGAGALFPREKEKLAILVLPLIACLLGAALRVYPFDGRLLLFLAPSVALLVAKGVDFVWETGRPNAAVIGPILLVLLFFQPISSAADRFVHPPQREDLKPVLKHVKERYEKGDRFYLYYGAIAAYTYYSEVYGFHFENFVPGIGSRGDWKKYADDLDKLRGKGRVWVVFSHIWIYSGADERLLFLKQLDQMGPRLDAMETAGAAAYLYDLSSDQSAKKPTDDPAL